MMTFVRQITFGHRVCLAWSGLAATYVVRFHSSLEMLGKGRHAARRLALDGGGETERGHRRQSPAAVFPVDAPRGGRTLSAASRFPRGVTRQNENRSRPLCPCRGFVHTLNPPRSFHNLPGQNNGDEIAKIY